MFKVGARVLARAPDEDEGEGRWVTARVLATRTTKQKALEYKISLDGYDSENDEWMEGGDERLAEYQAASDAKGADKQWASEKEAARLQSEKRRFDSRAVHGAALDNP